MAQLGLKLEQELAQLDADKGLDASMALRWAPVLLQGTYEDGEFVSGA